MRRATEEEVLDCFWRGERDPASRWTAAEVAERQRAWRERDGLFGGFPADVEWEPTAYGAFPDLLPNELEVYLGVSPTIDVWCQW